MARPKKQAETNSEELEELRFLSKIREKELQILYKDLAILKNNVEIALTQIGLINSCQSLSEAAFKAGKAFNPLDKASDKLSDMLENLYVTNDFEHYDDIIEDINEQF